MKLILLLVAATLASGQDPQQSAPPPLIQPSPPPEKEIEELQIKLKALELQRQIDSLKTQQQAFIKSATPKPPLPPCDATPHLAKSNRWLERLKRKAAQIAANETNKVGESIARSTHGTMDGSVIPTPQDVGSVTPTSKASCQPAVANAPGDGVSKQ